MPAQCSRLRICARRSAGNRTQTLGLEDGFSSSIRPTTFVGVSARLRFHLLFVYTVHYVAFCSTFCSTPLATNTSNTASGPDARPAPGVRSARPSHFSLQRRTLARSRRVQNGHPPCPHGVA